MKRFGAIGADWELIKKADNIMLATEARLLMKSKGEGWKFKEQPLPWTSMPVKYNRQVENILWLNFLTYSKE